MMTMMMMGSTPRAKRAALLLYYASFLVWWAADVRMVHAFAPPLSLANGKPFVSSRQPQPQQPHQHAPRRPLIVCLDSSDKENRNDFNHNFSSNDQQAKQIATLIELTQELQETIKNQAKEMESLKQRVNTLELEVISLKQRLQGVIDALGPAIDYALLETAVYIFGRKALPVSVETENTLYKAAGVMNQLLSSIVEEDTKPNIGFGLKTEFKSYRLGVEVLAGLVAYIDNKHITKQELECWPPDRNPLVHNGRLIDDIHPRPNGTHIPSATVAAIAAAASSTIASSSTKDRVPKSTEEVIAIVDEFYRINALRDTSKPADNSEVDEEFAKFFSALENKAFDAGKIKAYNVTIAKSKLKKALCTK